MRNYTNLFKISVCHSELEIINIGEDILFIYQIIEKDDEQYFTKNISVLFKVSFLMELPLFWFASFEEMYEELNDYISVYSEEKRKIIIIID